MNLFKIQAAYNGVVYSGMEEGIVKQFLKVQIQKFAEDIKPFIIELEGIAEKGILLDFKGDYKKDKELTCIIVWDMPEDLRGRIKMYLYEKGHPLN